MAKVNLSLFLDFIERVNKPVNLLQNNMTAQVFNANNKNKTARKMFNTLCNEKSSLFTQLRVGRIGIAVLVGFNVRFEKKKSLS